REEIRKRLTQLWDYEKYSAPRPRGPYQFFLKNDGLQDQPVLYRQEGPEGEPVAMLDPNNLSEDGTVALIDYFPTQDGKLMAFALSASGSDWQELHVIDVETLEKLDDVIQFVKFTNVAWAPDNGGFYYGRYPEPGSMPDAPPSTHHRLYWHTLGTPQEEDKLVYARPDAPDLAFNPRVTEDSAFLVVDVWKGTDTRNRFYYRPIASDEELIRLLDDADARYEFVGNVGTRFYFLTDLDAPNGRIIAIDVAQEAAEDVAAMADEVVPEGEAVIDTARIYGSRLVVVTTQHATHGIRIYSLGGEGEQGVALPAPGSIVELSGRHGDPVFFVNFHSFLYPPTIFQYDFSRRELAPLVAPDVDFDPEAYETKQVFYESADGTEVPMFLTHRKGLPLDGDNPTVLYGYGGFAVNLMPAFGVSWLVWLEMGGVVAVANLRGGNEYGELWHQAGMLENKQNVFDDFITAAEWLIAEGYTSREQLAIMGGSNGGLLVAACMVQRPELFGSVICRVPVADMLRYHRFTAGRYWIPEYGNAEEDPEHFRFLYAYSPLHNVAPGTSYPPALIATADTDDRVVPMHAKKLAATLQAADAGENPILLRIETKAGHGLGKPTSKVIDELADIYTFLAKTVGMSEDMGVHGVEKKRED
ncbi:MAG: prolyl oligopeptidase family serine peptidase, partial [Anaerolineae bacterium]|nr:prolyl oligopeptidase family serine peptidase [Anaerolineae bacterium]